MDAVRGLGQKRGQASLLKDCLIVLVAAEVDSQLMQWLITFYDSSMPRWSRRMLSFITIPACLALCRAYGVQVLHKAVRIPMYAAGSLLASTPHIPDIGKSA